MIDAATEAQREAAVARSRTMSLRALHRLGSVEVPHLGSVLAALAGLEAALVADLGGMRRAAEGEALARRERALVGAGPSGEGYQAVRQVLTAVSGTRDSLFTEG